MLVNIDVEFPKEIEAAANVDMRATFRKTMENRLRPRMDALVDTIKSIAHYQKIAGAYELEQKSTPDSVAFAAVNVNKNSRFLIGGSRPHMIPRAFGRPGAVQHPGVAADQPVLDAVASAEGDLLAASADGADKWANTMGTEA